MKHQNRLQFLLVHFLHFYFLVVLHCCIVRFSIHFLPKQNSLPPPCDDSISQLRDGKLVFAQVKLLSPCRFVLLMFECDVFTLQWQTEYSNINGGEQWCTICCLSDHYNNGTCMFLSIVCSLNVAHKLQFIIVVFAHHRLIQFDLKIAISMNRLVSQFIVSLLVGIIVMSMLTWNSHISPMIAVLQSMILCNRWHKYYLHECATVMKEKGTVQVFNAAQINFTFRME